MSDVICIKTFATREDAGVAQGLLESHGITTMVATDDCGGMRPHLAFSTGGTRLLVLADESERALALLEEFEEGNDA